MLLHRRMFVIIPKLVQAVVDKAKMSIIFDFTFY
jgi:hypothetical protein